MKNSAATTSEHPVLQKTGNSVNLEMIYPAGILHPLLVQPFIPLDRSLNSAIKRMFDICFSTMLFFFLLSWLIPLVALFIKLDSKGPVFFLQKRIKRNGKIFTCIKFRTMVCNAEADSVPSTDNDHRITRAGRFLRHHHLDELPQFINVLLGDMSVIGPRPYMISDHKKFERLIPQYHHRHRVKPGITGLAQVLGYVGPVKDRESLVQRMDNDLFYIQHWSAALDAKIAYRTVFKMAGRQQG
jgi:putative colanic acid biosynthesis UDP-glucose lipid carrier transferase